MGRQQGMTATPQYWLAEGSGFRADRYHRHDDLTAMLKVLDERAEGHGFQDWRPFRHPQLGDVELGGFEFKFSLQNPPGPMLEQVASRNGRSVLRLLGTGPRLELNDCVAELGGFEFKFSLQNPPGPMLEQVASRNGRSVLRLLGTGPRLELNDCVAEEVSDGVY